MYDIYCCDKNERYYFVMIVEWLVDGSNCREGDISQTEISNLYLIHIMYVCMIQIWTKGRTVHFTSVRIKNVEVEVGAGCWRCQNKCCCISFYSKITEFTE